MLYPRARESIWGNIKIIQSFYPAVNFYLLQYNIYLQGGFRNVLLYLIQDGIHASKYTYLHKNSSGDVCIHQTDDAIIVPCDVVMSASATTTNILMYFTLICKSLIKCFVWYTNVCWENIHNTDCLPVSDHWTRVFKKQFL